MAQHQVSPATDLGFVGRQRAVAGSAAVSSNPLGTPANYKDNTSLDARLTAISATTFPQARLDNMTQNDKIYALRVLDDAASI